MKKALVIAGVILAANATPAAAHRLDEYLQATTVLLTRDHVRLGMRLAPGVAIVKTVLDNIDTNRDGIISDAEQREYGLKVLGDLSLSIDKSQVLLRLVSWHFGTVDDLTRGLGEIQLAFDADAPDVASHRTMVFENHHRSAISAYLVNSLVPDDDDIHIVDQTRNYLQSTYEMSYTQAATDEASVSFGALGQWGVVLGGAIFLLVNRLKALKRRNGFRTT